MTAVWIVLLIVGTVAVLALRRFVPGWWGHHSNGSHDVGTVSQSWLTEHRAAHKDRFE